MMRRKRMCEWMRAACVLLCSFSPVAHGGDIVLEPISATTAGTIGKQLDFPGDPLPDYEIVYGSPFSVGVAPDFGSLIPAWEGQYVAARAFTYFDIPANINTASLIRAALLLNGEVTVNLNAPEYTLVHHLARASSGLEPASAAVFDELDDEPVGDLDDHPPIVGGLPIETELDPAVFAYIEPATELGISFVISDESVGSSARSFSGSQLRLTIAVPDVNITAPDSGADVFGTIDVVAVASGTFPIQSVAMLVDGELIDGMSLVGDDTYALSWDTTVHTDGEHTIEVMAVDDRGGWISDTRPVWIDNTFDDCNSNGVRDDHDLATCDGSVWCSDCNTNGVLDECDLSVEDPDSDGLVSADCNGNSIPDECEYSGYLLCIAGPDVPVNAECAGSDLDADNDVDLRDFALFQSDCAQPHAATDAEMVVVFEGPFEMGDPWDEGDVDERPVHTVYLSKYLIDTYEVTNQEYADALNWADAQGALIAVIEGLVCQAGSGFAYPYCDTHGYNHVSRISWDGAMFSVTEGYEDHPVVQVSWYGAVAYCNWRSEMEQKPPCYDLSTWSCDFSLAGYRLPTEAEWEKAAGWDPLQSLHTRFGEHTNGCGYNCLDEHRANYYNSGDPYEPAGENRTTPCGFYNGALHDRSDFDWPADVTSYQTQHAKSIYGCYDMSGNVHEWCYDRYSDTYYDISPEWNPTGPPSSLPRRILRGGSRGSNPMDCRSASRGGRKPSDRIPTAGFRCVLPVP